MDNVRAGIDQLRRTIKNTSPNYLYSVTELSLTFQGRLDYNHLRW